MHTLKGTRGPSSPNDRHFHQYHVIVPLCSIQRFVDIKGSQERPQARLRIPSFVGGGYELHSNASGAA